MNRLKVRMWIKKRKSVLIWLVVIVGIAFSSLLVSTRTYLSSINRQDPLIAQSGFFNDVTFSKDGEVRLYYFMGNSIRLLKLTYNGITTDHKLPIDGFIDTGVQVSAGGKASVRVFEESDFSNKAYGWVLPNSDETCGRKPYGQISISKFISQAEANGERIESIQCWSDWEPDKDPVLDFNDFVVIFSYATSDEPEPTPSPGGKSVCLGECFDDSSCLVGLRCTEIGGVKRCVNFSCSEDTDCVCDFETTPTPSPSPEASFPPSQPETGTPTWLTIGVLILGAGLVAVKLLTRI